MSNRTDISLSAEEVADLRLWANGLIDPFLSVDAAIERCIGVQAQDQSAAGLAIRARCSSVTSHDVRNSLFVERGLVKVWSVRNTLHLHRTVDWPTIFSALSGRETAFEKAAAKQGVDLANFRSKADGFIKASSSRSCFNYNDLKAADFGLGDFQVEGWSAGWGDLCQTLARRGPICHGETAKGQSQFVHAKQWVPSLKWKPPTREKALQELVLRYLKAYGPASAEDIGHWLGFARSDLTIVLDQAPRSITAIERGGKTLIAHRDSLEHFAKRAAGRNAAVIMLGKYDPLLLAYKAKDWLVHPSDANRVWRSGGRVEAVVLSSGRVVGTWRYKQKAKTLDVSIELFGKTSGLGDPQLRREARAVASFFGLELGKFEYK